MIKIVSEAEKLYLAEFNSYSDTMCVCDNTHSSYIEIPYGGLVIPESKIEYYKKYGEGFKSLKLVGSMYHGEV